MKLFLYDEKHENILNEMEISEAEIDAVGRVIDFLDRNNITNRYKKLVIAKSFHQSLDEDSGYPEINFHY